MAWSTNDRRGDGWSPLRRRRADELDEDAVGVGDVEAARAAAGEVDHRRHESGIAAILDEQGRYGIVILDKERARLLSVYLGEVEDDIRIKSRYPGGLPPAAGRSRAISGVVRASYTHTS